MTAIPITSEGRASCGSVTQTNSANTNKARNIGCRGLGGWLTKCRGSETRIGGTGERATSTPAIRQWLRLRTLFSSEKQTNQKKSWETSSFSPVRTIIPEKLLPFQKMSQKTWMGLAEKLLIVPFVCPLITFFFFSPPARLRLGRNAGISRCLLSAAVLRGGGGSGRRLVFESRLKYATTDFFFFFFWIPKTFPSCTYLFVWVYLWMYLLVCGVPCLARLSWRLHFPPTTHHPPPASPSSSVCSIWPLWWRVKGNDRPFEDALVPGSWIMQRVQRAGSQRKLQSLSASPVSLGERLQCCGEIRPTLSRDLVKLN